ncbi:MAG: ComEC/Rec2 family competence protein [Bacteroidetes bacterium]|nr:ComEC/Rec2 family competence protein [Bacteroidota bacterium]
MISRNPFPLFRLLMVYIAGIVTASLTGYRFYMPALIIYLFLVGIFFLIFHSGRFMAYSHQWIQGAAILVLFYIFGYQITIQSTGMFDHQHIINRRVPPDCIIGMVNEPLSEKEKSYSARMKVWAARDTAEWSAATGTIIVYLQKDSLSEDVRYGDVIIFRKKVSLITPPANPSQFNYKKYLANKGIYHSAFVSSGSWKLLDSNRGKPVRAFANALREKIMITLRRTFTDKDEFAVVTALLIGAKDDLDADLQQDFAAAGVLHILVVSGMHVGLIYVVLNSLFGFLRKGALGRFSHTLLVIMLMWLYSLITGFGPSILRAAAMFSLVAVGNSIQRMTSIYNTLVVSAFLLLLFSPFLISDTGFQLSYASVIGIVALQRPIYEMFSIKRWIPGQIWSIIAVTLAAQVGTLPLALMYFHQFPVYFILANMIIIPLSTFVIYAGIIFLIMSPVAVISSLLATIILFMTRLMLFTVDKVEYLPYSTITGISVTLLQCILIYGMIVSLVIFWQKRRPNYLISALMILLVLCTLLFIRNLERCRQCIIAVYSVPGSSAYDLIDGKSHVLIADSAVLTDGKKTERLIRDFWISLGLKTGYPIMLDKTARYKGLCPGNPCCYSYGHFIQFRDKRIVIIDDDFRKPSSVSAKMQVDFAIIRHNARITLEDIHALFDVTCIIIDSSNKSWKTGKWRDEGTNLKKMPYIVPESGAFIFSW